MGSAGSSRDRSDLRRKRRRSFHYNARIETHDDAELIPCTILDVSDIGARLQLQDESELPPNFVLLLTPNGGPRRQCRVVWQTGVAVGVEFPKDH